MSTSKSSLRPVLLALAVGAIAFAAIWQLGPQTPAQPRSLAGEGEQPAPGAPPLLPAPVPAPAAAVDAATPQRPQGPPPGERPADLVDEAYQRALHGKRLHPRKAIELYNRFKEHPEDGRPQLVLAFDAVNRAWYEHAVGHYEKALRADPQLRHEPRVLPDLLEMAAMGLYHDKAASVIVEAYGQDALAALDERMARANAQGQAKHAELLGQLRRELLR